MRASNPAYFTPWLGEDWPSVISLSCHIFSLFLSLYIGNHLNFEEAHSAHNAYGWRAPWVVRNTNNYFGQLARERNA